jgi:hypothetical protein
MIGDEEKYPTNVVITRLCPTCSYCGDMMNFTSKQVKRRVPSGAKDLGIYDERHFWQCRRCEASSTECLLICKCGQPTIDYSAVPGQSGNRENPSQTIVENHEAGLYGYLCTYQNNRDDIWGYECISCVQCNHCHKELKSTRLVNTGRFSEHNKSEVEWLFYHEDCFSIKQKAQEQQKQKAKRKQRQETRSEERQEIVTRGVINAVKWAAIVYPIIGFAGCNVRMFNSMNSTIAQQYKPGDANSFIDAWWAIGLVAYKQEAIYASLFIVGISLIWALLRLLRLHSALRLILFLVCATAFGYVGKITIESGAFRNSVAETSHLTTGVIPPGGSRETPQATSIINADRITRGRTAEEKVHEFVLSPNQWIATSLQITPNQEVMINHFASNDPVKVNLGGITDTRLQKAGTILALYTSTDCSRDPGIKAKITYYCIQLNQPEGLKLYASNAVRIGVAVKNR